MTDILPPEQGARRRLSPRDFMQPGRPSIERRNKRKHPIPGEYRPNPKGPRPNRKPERAPRPMPGEPGYKPRVPRVKPTPGVSPKLPLPTKRLPRVPIPLGPLLLGLELLDPLLFPRPYRIPNPLDGWRKCWGDCAVVTPNRTAGSPSALCASPNLMCQGGQGSGAPNAMTLDPTWTACLFGYAINIFGSWRQTYHSYYARSTATPLTGDGLVPSMRVGIPLWPMTDPNLDRFVPSPMPPSKIGVGTPLPDENTIPMTGPELGGLLETLPWYKTSISAVSAPIGSPQVPSRPGQTVPEPAPGRIRVGGPRHVRRRPPRKTKELKAKGPIYLAMAIADSVSEGSEVVDAIYESLPKDVRKRWKCKRSAPFIDSAGQYGIDNADCKAQAVFHNLHKVDPAEAFRNIVANIAEDKLIGSMHKLLPRNMINAAGDGQFAVSQLVQALLEELGLKDGDGFTGLKPKALSLQ